MSRGYHLNGVGSTSSTIKKGFTGYESVYVLTVGKHDALFTHTPYTHPVSQSDIGGTPRGACYKCKNRNHIQNYCPLQFCTACQVYGHHKQSCAAVAKNSQLTYDKDGGPLELCCKPHSATKLHKITSIDALLEETPVAPPPRDIPPPTLPPPASKTQRTRLSEDEMMALTAYKTPDGSIASLV